jgi:hypothetical protein
MSMRICQIPRFLDTRSEGYNGWGAFLVLPRSHARQQIVPPQREELTTLNRALTNELPRTQWNAAFGTFRFDTREPSFERIIDARFLQRALLSATILAAARNPTKSWENKNEHRGIQSVRQEKGLACELACPARDAVVGRSGRLGQSSFAAWRTGNRGWRDGPRLFAAQGRRRSERRLQVSAHRPRLMLCRKSENHWYILSIHESSLDSSSNRTR